MAHMGYLPGGCSTDYNVERQPQPAAIADTRAAKLDIRQCLPAPLPVVPQSEGLRVIRVQVELKLALRQT
jgi:hypothetical protein